MKDINATVIVDLRPTEKEILNNLQKDARWGIGRAKKEGLTIEESKEWEEFYEIYKKTMVEGRGNIETLEHLKEHGDVLFICKKDKKIIAGAAIEIINGVPMLCRNASSKEYLHMQPNNLLYWHCILWCKRKGYDKFDLGGWQINARGHTVGVNKFKEKWGKIIYYYKSYPFYVAIGRKLIRKFRFFWWLNKKLKKG